ncbi:Crp/Fnr family transcriptional regulator [Paraburkholderia phenoliruptrix]|uniref:Transcriptional regulator, Crp/Fnr family n=2 Tax=Paraburkholderia phenoliruptrix TaxID=252970 RepID=K0DXN9_9BURK|nr:Crp/Fnr family transcriptional regulator [Paraburkholderia phenoliruptrix]AFT88134.1 transcriptional regulator, Crp/Fnr family [Paraburkholderia phenoliruptrix BR3459a]MDR6390631.1 CRP-like cAMP-binding protein [Paraburkholderia phenoliruptrix]MDR6418386.1 CRP-like cAMP-binding protein [Paraburkholderia phenoliruptrix]WMY12128.1 Crp/Fnr family transcriptional regulator [Paraburkholderia phenoliruptrix]
MNQQRSPWTRTAAPGEVIYSEGFVADAVIYVIADGKVEISTQCDEKKVILATLGKGEFFGEAALLPPEPRAHTAKALSFCQLTAIAGGIVEEELERVSPLLRHIVRTMIRRVKKKDDILATNTHADFLPGVLSYAHVLSLMAGAEMNDRFDARARRPQNEEVSIPLAEVLKKCNAIAGHSRPHVMAMLKRMEKLNLVSIESGRSERLNNSAGRYSASDGAAGRQLVTFDPVKITERAQQVANHDLDVSISSELELIELDDLEALIGVDRKVILNKLSHAEIAEDIFAFRKTKVLNYVEEKGLSYFSRRNVRGAGELNSLDDLAFVDQRTLFEAVSAFDTYDLAKLLSASAGQPIDERLQSVMTEARKKEVSWVMRREIKIDPVEIVEIEQRFIDTVRALKSPAAHAAPAES